MPPKTSKKKRASARPPRPWIPVAIVGGIAVLAVALVIAFANTGGNNNGSSSNLGAAATPGPTHSVPQNGATVGSDSAPVTMIEYFKFDCPHCADFASKVAPTLEKDYVDTGKLRIEFRPLAVQGDLLNASEAAMAAGEQGRFWEYYDLVFANQSRGFSTSDLKAYASALGLDTKAFNSVLDSGKYKDQIVNETNDALNAGIQSTPTFFFVKTSELPNLQVPYTGQTKVMGVQPTNPVAPFKAAIDPILAATQ